MLGALDSCLPERAARKQSDNSITSAETSNVTDVAGMDASDEALRTSRPRSRHQHCPSVACSDLVADRTWHADILMRGITYPKSALQFQAANASRPLQAAASQKHRLNLSSENFRITYSANTERRAIEDMLRTLEAAR